MSQLSVVQVDNPRPYCAGAPRIGEGDVAGFQIVVPHAGLVEAYEMRKQYLPDGRKI